MRRPDPNICAAAMLTLTMLASASPAEHGAAPPFAPGERLHYRGYLFGWLPVGDVWFETQKVSYHGKEAYRIDSRAYGSYLVYTLDIRLTSYVDPQTLRSVEFRRREVGTEKRDFRVLFDRANSTGTFFRKEGRFSSVAQMDAAPWRKRAVFPIGSEVNDPLYTLYFARDIGDTVGTKRSYQFVEKRDVWKASVSVVGEERLDMGSLGTFDALDISIVPESGEEKAKGARFEGLFGVQGSLRVVVDKKNRIPLIVSGELPFVFFRPKVSVVLRDRSFPGSTAPASRTSDR